MTGDHGFSKCCPSGNHMLSMRDELDIIIPEWEEEPAKQDFWWSEIGESWWCEYSDGGV
jgi:hypothetical protein